jgi:hypothetical protein
VVLMVDDGQEPKCREVQDERERPR